jgi:hypothetical protein
VWAQIAPRDTEHVARAWFIGANPFLDEDTPLTAIQEDRAKQIIAAATAFMEDSAHA